MDYALVVVGTVLLTAVLEKAGITTVSCDGLVVLLSLALIVIGFGRIYKSS